MLFSSYIFIFAFLPVSVLGYWLLRPRLGQEPAIAFLVIASLFFYGWWNPIYLPLLMGSLVFNFYLGKQLNRSPRKGLLVIGISANLALLAYFKYADFFISNANAMGAQLPLLNLVLPLGISFFTFQKVAYLVDSYKQQVHDHGFNHYALFVTFFPQLIAGPIVHHGEVLPQFTHNKPYVEWDNIAKGLFIFIIGLSKKLIIADELAEIANAGWSISSPLTLLEAWATTLAYTFQLYFDFSAYSDMAIGAALLFSVRLPANFLSPYRAMDIADFWRRWHITLGRFLKDYLYLPLGGNRLGKARTALNLFITFFLSGLWHGAGWTFVLWGSAHGIAVATHHLWHKAGLRLPTWFAWLLTFLFVHLTWVLFRAPDLVAAMTMYQSLFGYNGVAWINGGVTLPFGEIVSQFRAMPSLGLTEMMWIATALLFACLGRNSIEQLTDFNFKTRWIIALTALMIWSSLLLNRVGDFLYFNF